MPGSRRIQRTIVLGTREPGRVGLDALDELVTRLRNLVREVGRDVGESAALERIQLVGFERGSTRLVFEEEPLGNTSVLELSMRAASAISSGESPPEILTEAALNKAEAFATLGSELAEAGISVALAYESDGVPQSVPLRIPHRSRPPDDTPGRTPPEIEASDVDEGGPVLEPLDWALRFSGQIERLDERECVMWVRVDGGDLVQVPLTRDLFEAADADDARWKHVAVLARSASAEVRGIQEVLELEPTEEQFPIAAEPLSESAQRLEPTFEKLMALAVLPARWDGYDAKPIPASVISAVRSFLAGVSKKLALAGIELEPPFVAPLSSGAVQLEWEVGARFLELEFKTRQSLVFLRGTADAEAEGAATRSRGYELVRWVHSGEAE